MKLFKLNCKYMTTKHMQIGYRTNHKFKERPEKVPNSKRYKKFLSLSYEA